MKLLAPVGLALAAGFLLVGSIVGCGDDDGGDELSRGAPDQDLVGAVAPAKPHVDYVDVAGVREQLGLPRDQDPALPENSEAAPSAEHLVFSNVASSLLVYTPRPRPGPLAETIDGASVSAGTTPRLVSADAVAAVRTSQPFGQLAARLEEHGYERRGDLVTSESTDAFQPFFPAVADGGDGLIILAGSAEAAEKALETGGANDSAASLLDDVGGVVRRVDVPTPQRGCVRSIAVGQDLDPALGEIVVTVANEASEEAFVLDDQPDPEDHPNALVAPPGVEFQTVEADGDVVRANFSYELGAAGGAIGLIDLAFSMNEVYRC